MRHIKDVLRLRFHAGLSIRQIKASTGLSVGAIQKLLKAAQKLEIGWPLPPDLDDAELNRRLYPSTTPAATSRFAQPDWINAHQDLKRGRNTARPIQGAATAIPSIANDTANGSRSNADPCVRYTAQGRKYSLIMPVPRYPL